MNRLRMEANKNGITGSDKPTPDVTVKAENRDGMILVGMEMDPEDCDPIALACVLLAIRSRVLEAVYTVANDMGRQGFDDLRQSILDLLEHEDIFPAPELID